jgi:hypothetical protein
VEVVPSNSEIERVFQQILAGEISRDEADRWAAQWVTADDPPNMLGPAWEALQRLHGCDLRHGPDEDYLHSDEQLGEWLAEFRAAQAR